MKERGMKLQTIPDNVFEVAGTIVGLSASMFIAIQIHSELSNDKPSTLSICYVCGFMVIFLFWTIYGVRFKRIAIWLTNGIATLLQVVLLAVTLFK
jgi:uncharacterized protein with PQ loop repeat